MTIIDEENQVSTARNSCYACCRTVGTDGHQLELCSLSATWGKNSIHNGAIYNLSLCEECLFRVLGDLRFQRAIQMHADDPEDDLNANVGVKVAPSPAPRVAPSGAAAAITKKTISGNSTEG